MTPNRNRPPSDVQAAVPVIIVPCRRAQIESLLGKEWLMPNRIGAYASGTVAGCNTRRYHGLLVASTLPPVGRVVTLSTVMEQLVIAGKTHELSTNEFPDTISPRGYEYLIEYREEDIPTFVYRVGTLTLTKEILLADQANVVAIRYTLQGGSAKLRLSPFLSMRDFHALRKFDQPHQFTFEKSDNSVVVQDRLGRLDAVHLMSRDATFEPKADWWRRFSYRADIARGQDGQEDLYTPGTFAYDIQDGQQVQFTASLGEPTAIAFETTRASRRQRLRQLAGSVGPGADGPIRRLAVATDAFVVRRSFPGRTSSTTILAGYPWFGDWGRDTFISLPGLLLATGRFDEARQVFRTFADAIADGMVPNRFDDYSTTAHYNSIDASLWFIIAAERFVEATGDREFWADTLMPACQSILRAYGEGTKFDIHADADGLLCGGSSRTQLTWMDACLGGVPVTPRHGKCVEVNALWHSAHRIMADRCRGVDNAASQHFAGLADRIGPAFVKTFWNEHLGWMFDCISDNWPDASLRPNQILAVSLPHTPLSHAMQLTVLNAVTEKLLTPYGLRTLSPDDSRYRRNYGGSWESRDRAYHQGTVWAWLIGPFIEAYLKVHGAKPFAVAQAQQYLLAFDAHLHEAGLGQISEIFDGDFPHAPCGCFAQAWSVGEVLRAKLLVRNAAKGPE